MINQQKRNKTFIRKAKIETLEPRIMMSADLPGLEFLQNNHETEDHLQQSKIILKEAEQNIAQSLTEAVSEDSQQQIVRKELIVIDKSIDDYQSLVNKIQTSESDTVAFEIALIETNENGIEAIDHHLSANATTSYDAIHILSHGDVGQFQLGNLNINNQQLSGYPDSLELWSNNLTENADILLYACNLTADESGEQLIQQIASLTNADVAASDDITGHDSLSGDWQLEYQTGTIESKHNELISIFKQWQGTLDAPGVNDAPSFFAGNGIVNTEIGLNNDRANSLVVQADGKTIVAGYTNNGIDNDFAVTRYNSDGTIDITFGVGGTVTTDLDSGDDVANSVKVQDDGKIIVVGQASNGSDEDVVLVRYNVDGSLDSDFGFAGVVRTDIASEGDFGNSVFLQSDGKIVVGGSSWNGSNYDFLLIRYNSDGTLDDTFDGDGIVTTAVGPLQEYGRAIVIQSDGKIVLSGTIFDGDDKFLLVRYNSDGSLDSSFGAGDGIVTSEIGSNTGANFGLTLQNDGKIIASGYSLNSGDYDFTTIRYNTDGSLDNTFGVDGVVNTNLGPSNDFAYSVKTQVDGKILVAGYSWNGSNNDISVVRYNSDGSLDETFAQNGVATSSLSSVEDRAFSLSVLDDGKIAVAGYSSASSDEFTLLKFNSDGSLDQRFNLVNTLNANPVYIEGTSPVVLDGNVEIFDAELSAADNFEGASLTLQRNGGANEEDVFSATGSLDDLADGSGTLRVDGITIGNYSNAVGTLVFSFNANATNALVNSAMQQIAYSNTSDTPESSIQLDWDFNDNNLGAQGSGGSASFIGLTLVNIEASNDAPTFSEPGGFSKTSIGTYYDYGEAVVIQPDGKIIVATDASFGGNPDYQFMVSRYNIDGTLDTSFGDNGTAAINIGSGGERVATVALQADGKILLTGYISGFDIALVRLDIDGSLDTSFGGGDGVAITNVSLSDQPLAIAVQSDDKIIVGGTSFFSDRSNDFSLVRFNSNGTLDSSFGGGDGKVTTDFYGSYDAIKDVFVLPDGKIIVGGVANSPTPEFAAARYNPDGSLDTSFGGGDGLVSTSLGSGNDFGEGMTLQQDGKILVTGLVRVGGSYDIGIVRYDVDGVLDSSFGGGDGKVVVGAGEPYDAARGITVQADGKILVTGSISADGATDHSLWRFNVDGSLDTSFGNGLGYVTASIANGISEGANDVVVQADGKIVITGYVEIGTGNYAVSLLRFNADGSPDAEFGMPISTLDNNPTFIENGPAVVLDSDVKVFDAELSAIDNFSGATLVIERNSVANTDDVFSSSGTLGDISATSGSLLVDGINIGTFNNSAGTLTFTFNTSATNALVNSAMQQIAYSNLNDNPPANVQLDWLFNDNNLSDQGSGGVLSISETMTVNIIAANDAPEGISIDSESGIEQIANNFTSNDQDNPVIAAFDDGSYIISWTSAGQDGDRDGVYAAVFNADGTIKIPEFQVNQGTFDSQSVSSVSTFSDGGFVIAWQDFLSGAYSWTEARVFAADGSPITGDILLESGYNNANENYTPSVSVLDDNRFVVAWKGEVSGVERLEGAIYDRNTGSNLSGILDLGFIQGDRGAFNGPPATHVLDNGGFAVSWLESNNYGQEANPVSRLAFFDSNGVAIGSEIVLGGNGSTDLAQLDNGNVVVVYGDAENISAQVFTDSGLSVVSEFQVSFSTGLDEKPSVVATDDGGFYVAWQNDSADAEGYGILGQSFDATGNSTGNVRLMNQFESGDQTSVELVVLADGSIRGVYNSSGLDENGSSVIDWRFSPDVYVYENATDGRVVATVTQVNDPDNNDTHNFSLLDDASGAFAIDAVTGVITVADTSKIDYEIAANMDITIRTTDSGGLNYDEVLTINILDIPAPVVDLDSNDSNTAGLNFSNSWTENNGPVSITDSDAVISNQLVTSLQSLSVIIDNPINGNNEVLAANTSGTLITANYDAASATLMLTGFDSIENYQQVLRSVTYDNTLASEIAPARTIHVIADNGGDENMVVAVSTIDLNFENDLPSIQLNATPSFVVGEPPVVLDSGVTVFDEELSGLDNFNGSFLVLERFGEASSADVFKSSGSLGAIDAPSGRLIVDGEDIGSYSHADGTLIFNFENAATNELVNLAMQQIAYSYNAIPTESDIQMLWTFYDNQGASNSGLMMIELLQAQSWSISGSSNVFESSQATYSISATGPVGSVDISLNDIDTNSADYANFSNALSEAVANRNDFVWDGNTLSYIAEDGYSTIVDDTTSAFVDISTTGIELGLSDDASELVDIGFDFNFFGETYSNVHIVSNGVLNFGDSNTDFANRSIEAGIAGNPGIALFWDDLNPADTDSDGVYMQLLGDSGNQKLVVQWNDVVRYNGSSGEEITIQVVLHENTSKIEMRYLDADAGSIIGGEQATIGITAADGRFLQYSLNEQALTNDSRIIYTPSNFPIEPITFTVDIIEDQLQESQEAYQIVLSNPVNSSIDRGSVTTVIEDFVDNETDPDEILPEEDEDNSENQNDDDSDNEAADDSGSEDDGNNLALLEDINAATEIDDDLTRFEVLSSVIQSNDNDVNFTAPRALATSISTIDEDGFQSLQQPTIELLPLNEVFNSEQFEYELEKMRDEIEDAYDESSRFSELTVQAAAGVGISLTAGFVSWALRSGSLIASMFSVMPFWRNFDPFPILSNTDKENASTPQVDHLKTSKAEKLFD